MAHFTYGGARDCKGGKPGNRRFTAWAEYPDGSRAEVTDRTGPQANRWMIQQRHCGATRVGYGPMGA